MADAVNWPTPIPWRELRRGERRLRFKADESTCRDIAERLDLLSVATIEAEVTVTPWLDGARFVGRLRATATRTCGVSLEPFDEEIDEPINLRLVPAGSPNAPAREGGGLLLIVEGDDPPEEVPGDSVDLAAWLVEHLALGLSPFPRKPGARFEPPSPSAPRSPFAALSALRRPGDGG